MSSSSSVNDKKKLEEALSPAEHDLQHDLSLSDAEKDLEVESLAKEMGINHNRLMWKIDMCVVPPFCLLYFLAFLDRVNISNAKVYGIEKELGLHGDQFNTCLTVFFVPYVVFEVLSNYCLKIVKPHIWLSGMIFLFGIVTICVAFTKNYGGLIVCRLFLGVFEAGSFPSIFYIMANFYNKLEAQRRFSIFFSCTCLAGGCAGALAFRIHDLDGVHGYSSWKWIYLIEGSFTAGLAFLLFFLVTDFPEQARFMNQNERDFLKKKLEIYSGNSGFEIKQTWADIGKVFKEPLLYLAALAYFFLIVPSYSYAFFAPTIIKLLGYTNMEAQSHSIYPWLVSLGFSIMVAFASDRMGRRLPFAILAGIIAIVGLAMKISGYCIRHWFW
ncbi:unnamed protein product [Ambrosiozyma monospora]|uniref:Unnamed protein product n=1 Tax=Ambrosiozyma monospora TaxID=43982 RepID=A0ACB5TMZ5_AMBMO|nr:unnamed protein product [Ambrosiozyma monospora]